ncbi:MAG: carboxypeptidase-like regulatory domain-containing protein, partial [Cyclobacteriaceae bacterium]
MNYGVMKTFAKSSNALLIILMTILGAHDADARQLTSIKGRVIDSESLEPLPFASVFFNNSTFGAVADEEGNFEFLAKPGNYELIVNFFSYQPIIYPITVTETEQKKYIFKLSPLKYDLKEISVESTRDEVWYTNYAIFKQSFIGSSKNAAKCEILNPEVLIIDFNNRTRVMTVRARDVLKIENKGLGYD